MENLAQGCSEGNQRIPTLSSAVVIDTRYDQEEGSASMLKLVNSSFNSENAGTITKSISAGKGMRGCSCSSSSSDGDGCFIVDRQVMVSAVHITAIC